MSERWFPSHRVDARALPLADRHYNRRKIGSPQFVPPGRCAVMLTRDADALWVTSWPFAQYVRHAWPGAWVNSLFRNESSEVASDLILEAVARTRGIFGEPPPLGMVSFVDSREVPGVKRRGAMIFGYCYLRAGFRHVGYTKGGLWAWQLAPADMPPAIAPFGQLELLAEVA
ncbi:MAG TPA: hypothetical protein VGQ44_17105 [Gemmatimonadaceae bacterium]|jgi:hypothetical protein|nr:hypothetical protein [Gemmatimonadaceae bacterium]